MAKTRTFSFSNSLLQTLLVFFVITPIITAIPDCINPSNALSTQSSSPWTSPSKDFAFGFQFVQFKDPRYVPLLSIYFTKSPNNTIVWYAKPNQEIPVGSSINITNNGLVIYNPKGSEIWSRPEKKDKRVTCASMKDNGNFVLKDKDGNIVWESFEEPSDTLLPGQNFSKSQPFNLQARQSETNFSTSNNFNLSWQDDGNLVLYYSQNHQEHEQAQNYAYWATGTDGRGSRLFFDEFGRIYVTDDNNTELFQVTNGTPGSTQYFYMARIESDGVFRLYD
ncbi:G-type lectin S-receptor-like serine/threonine-protein kinase LECRK2 [Arachis stenosperma]|uniref:G-type lectin S-receptor-like serine/threonine-protein kinase LECRK2 n=1 Tax=Arachis stenosperma TaxID=217475 RepID=UPI0025AD13C4|nr:G-type lectin S-receptor-like serine/threonine-protein kinase LECRK2 [Arachis stenosperma]